MVLGFDHYRPFTTPVNMPRALTVESQTIGALRHLDRVALTTTWTTPEHLAEHRARLVELINAAGHTNYTSAFSYPKPDLDAIERTADTAEKLASQIEGEVRHAVVAHVHQIRQHVRVIASRDDARLTAWEQENCGRPDQWQMAAAARILEQASTNPPVEPRVGSTQIARRMTEALAAHGCAGWTVEVTTAMAARASVNGALRRVRVRADLQVTPSQLDRLCVHEIGGHVLRWVNSCAQPEEFVSIPLGHTVATEEGLAALLEETMGVADDAQLRIYAARTMAVEVAQRGSIVEVGRQIAPMVGVQQAAEIAIRVKRGMVQPNEPGGPTKDHSYLAGLLELRAVLAADPEAVELLRCSKWPLENLSQLQKIQAAGGITGVVTAPIRAALCADT